MSLNFTKTDREGRNTTYGCDPLNRLKSVTDPLNGRTLYGYHSCGNLISLMDAAGRATRFEYDRNKSPGQRDGCFLHKNNGFQG